MESTASVLLLYTDGACIRNPGPGGWAALTLGGAEPRTEAGGFRRTTNNRMELYAVIAGLRALPPGSTVTVFSDSLYIVNAMRKGWARRWRENGWMRNPQDRALNDDLWDQLLDANDQHNVTYRWVRGHSRDVHNGRCDKLARAAAKEKNLPPDLSYEALPPSPPAKSPNRTRERLGSDPNELHRWLTTSLSTMPYETRDLRANGGALWVIAGPEFRAFATKSASRGIAFRFAAKGSKATMRQPAWYTRWPLP